MVNYVCCFFFNYVFLFVLFDDYFMDVFCEFLWSNIVLEWIEYVLVVGNLVVIV